MTTKIRAQIQTVSEETLAEAAERIVTGRLVAFPTETVYGLGASALDESAIRKIFEFKGRPSSDPLIVHISSLEMARPLVEATPKELAIFEVLAAAFWPGPLTLILPVSPQVAHGVTGGLHTVGLRFPAHPVARRLIEKCGVPVAAPSANRFGHVSPTSAAHVLRDLGEHDVLILDGGKSEVGIESTIVRISSEQELHMLRRGAVTPESVQRVLSLAGLEAKLVVLERHAGTSSPLEAPGQLLVHYAPFIPGFILSNDAPNGTGDTEQYAVKDCCVLDYGGKLSHLASSFLAYQDLSPSKNPSEASAAIFSALRKMEEMNGAKAILLPDLRKEKVELAMALADRVFRAAAGRVANLKEDFVRVFS